MDGCAVIRGLWGNATLTRRGYRPPDAHHDILTQFKKAKKRQDQVDKVYVFGQDNYDYLCHLDYEAVLIDHRSWAMPEGDREYTLRNGAVRGGASHWWHKLKIFDIALQEHKAIVWVDTRAEQLKRITDEYWLEKAAKKPVQAAIYRVVNRVWGAPWRGDDAPRGLRTSRHPSVFVPGCGCVYLREHEIAKELLRIQAENKHWLDHQVLAWYIDQVNGGWMGVNRYIRRGYQLSDYYYDRMPIKPNESDIVWYIPPR